MESFHPPNNRRYDRISCADGSYCVGTTRDGLDRRIAELICGDYERLPDLLRRSSRIVRLGQPSGH
jgi:hypothetical protein